MHNLEFNRTFMLSTQVTELAGRIVLCWFATVDATGQPNVSPKEIFAVYDSEHLVIANIASPASARNITSHARVCVSFIDIFVQKGFKVAGVARYFSKSEPDYARWSQPLAKMAGPRFKIHGVFVIKATSCEPIVAPSYRLYPEETTEESQIDSAMCRYGVRASRGDA
jgi:predicted pyridoxine 5'-phosphate oxidase superfamily flavin-nucleotide-binding protein